jgi:hypothetical protein
MLLKSLQICGRTNADYDSRIPNLPENWPTFYSKERLNGESVALSLPI